MAAVNAKYPHQANGSAGVSEEVFEFGQVPLLGEDLEIDDDNVTWVFIFSRCKDEGGVVDTEKQRENPLQQAQKIFYRPRSWYPGKFSIFNSLDDTAVDEGRYQDLVRAEFLSLLQHNGLQALSSDSIDRDEVLLKVSLGLSSPRLAELAEHYFYKMPISEDKYEVKLNEHDNFAPAFTEFNQGSSDKMAPFRSIDEIRLILRWIVERVNLQEMQKQGIVVSYFPAIRYNDMMELCEHWATVRRAPFFPSEEDADKVRSYFGEQIGFFFQWFGYYNKYMAALAFISVVTYWMKHSDWLSSDFSTWTASFYAVCLVCWVASFNEIFKRKANRCKQRWGMKDWDNQQATSLPSYKPELDGTKFGHVLKTLSSLAVVVYMVVFASAIVTIAGIDKEMREEGDMRLAKWGPLLISLLMKVSSFIWGKLALRLVELQNHRTETRFNDALAWTLASVKLFVALFPFVDLAFLEPWVSMTCAKTLGEAAAEVYGAGFPSGTPLFGKPVPNATDMTSADLAFLEGYWHKSEWGNACITGCAPVACRMGRLALDADAEELICDNSCWVSLKSQLITYYALQVVTSLVFLVIPIVITKITVTLEIAKVIGYRSIPGAIVRSFLRMKLNTANDSDSSGSDYSLLQYQAKCSQTSPYEYNSWGGSFVEDFLDLAVGYSLLACFAQIVPMMVVVGLGAHMLLYRILAYRMTNVTCRPFPDGAEGIGTWQGILDTIATLAVTCNVALATFCQAPIKYWSRETQLLFFILAEKTLFGLRGLVGAVWSDEPDDVVRIEDYNAQVAVNLLLCPLPWSPEVNDYSEVDIGLISMGDEASVSAASDSETGMLTRRRSRAQRSR